MSTPRHRLLNRQAMRLFSETNDAYNITEFVPVFTDTHAAMFQNEIKTSLRNRYSPEIWEFLDAVSRLDGVYDKLLTAITAKNTEAAAQQYKMMLSWTNKIIDKFLKPNADKYLNIGDVENKRLLSALEQLPNQLPEQLDAMQAYFNDLERAFAAPITEALKLIRINIDDTHRERVVKAESLTLAANGLLLKIQELKLIQDSMVKHEKTKFRTNLPSDTQENKAIEEAKTTSEDNSKVKFVSRFTHSFKQLNTYLDPLQKKVEDLLINPNHQLPEFEAEFLKIIEDNPGTAITNTASTIEKLEKTSQVKISERIKDLVKLFSTIHERLQKFYNIEQEVDFTIPDKLRPRSLTVETPSSRQKGPTHFHFTFKTPKNINNNNNNNDDVNDNQAPPNTPKRSTPK